VSRPPAGVIKAASSPGICATACVSRAACTSDGIGKTAAVPPYHGAQLRSGLYGLDKRL